MLSYSFINMKGRILRLPALLFLISIVSSFNSKTALFNYQERYLLDCLKSEPQCSGCSSDKFGCQSCNPGFCLNSSSHCYQYKIDNCQSCSLQKCLTCDSGYYSSDSDKKCLSLVLAVVQVIAIIVGSLIGLFIIITLYRRCCRDNRFSRPNSYLQNIRPIPASSNSLGLSFERMEIQINSRQISWQNMGKKEGSDNCTICLSGSGNAKTNCGHLYHLICLKEWMKRSRLCPICRASVFDKITIICEKCRQFSFQSSMNRQALIQRRQDFTCNRCTNNDKSISR